MPELLVGLAEYFVFYNGGRFHQALGYKTPDQVYQTGEGGGAKIVDHFSKKRVFKGRNGAAPICCNAVNCLDNGVHFKVLKHVGTVCLDSLCYPVN
jgi:hypothetical protein